MAPKPWHWACLAPHASLSRSPCGDEGRAVVLLLPRVPVGIVTLKGRMPSPAARLFVEQAREVAGVLAKA